MVMELYMVKHSLNGTALFCGIFDVKECCLLDFFLYDRIK